MFTELRNQLVDDLKVIEGVGVYDASVPPSMTFPLIVVESPLTQYITAGQLVGEFEISLDVTVVVSPGRDDLGELHRLIEEVLKNTQDWAFRGIDPPLLSKINGAEYPAAVVHIAKAKRLY